MDWTIAKVNTKGQVVIPQKMRKSVGIRPNAPVQVFVSGGSVMIAPARPTLISSSMNTVAYR
jgi:AbrB family looped-hinge helix DNA binding protein